MIRKLIGVTAVCIEHFSTFRSKYISDDTDNRVLVTCADAALPTSALLNHAPTPAHSATILLSTLTHIVLPSLQIFLEYMCYLREDDCKINKTITS